MRRPLPARGIRPGGWLSAQLQADLDQGVVGVLDQLVPRLAEQDAAAEAGWRQGWVRHAFLTGDEDVVQAARRWAESTRALPPAPDLGVRAARLLALLAYADCAGDGATRDAVVAAVAATVAEHPVAGPNPFLTAADADAATRALGLTDVLWELYQGTGDGGYLRYALWLFEQYATAAPAGADVQPKALRSAAGFAGPAVHTYRNWRALSHAAAAAQADPAQAVAATQLRGLLEAYRGKLTAALTPSGAPGGAGTCAAVGTAEVGYEHCGVVELMDSYALRLQVAADPAELAVVGDAMESLLFNVGFGGRDHDSAGVARFISDDAWAMVGVHQGQQGYSYSPVPGPGLCCAAAAGRLLPGYLRHQWLVEPGALWLALLGPSRMDTLVDGVPVSVEQVTGYPAVPSVRLVIDVGQALSAARGDGDPGLDLGLDLELRVRVPGWAEGVQARGARYDVAGRWLVLHGPWAGRTVIDIEFDAAPRVVDVPAGKADGARAMIAHGPLLFALPLRGRRDVVRTYGLAPGDAAGAATRPRAQAAAARGRFVDVLVHPVDPEPKHLRLVERAQAELMPDPDWRKLRIRLPMWDDTADRISREELWPLGTTQLRQVTFPRG